MRAAFTKTGILALLLGVLFSLPLQAGTSYDYSKHPEDVNATMIGQMETAIQFSSAGSEIIVQIDVFRTSSNQTDYVIVGNSMKLSGTDCEEITSMPLPSLYDMVAHAAIAQGIAMGYQDCDVTCLGDINTRVYSPACMRVLPDQYCDTKYDECGPEGYTRRDFSVCCENGAQTPNISLVNTYTTGGCPPGSQYCKSTAWDEAPSAYYASPSGLSSSDTTSSDKKADKAAAKEEKAAAKTAKADDKEKKTK